MNKEVHLFLSRRFLPLFITQLTGCLNDCIIKSALIINLAYGTIAAHSWFSAEFLIVIINSLFILPFVFLAGISGQLADKYDKSLLSRIIKITEIGIVSLGIYGLSINSLSLVLSVVFLLGIHSSFFSPIKYSILPDHLDKEELLTANGYIEASTFIGILIGGMVGGFYTIVPTMVLGILIISAFIGLVSSFYILPTHSHNSQLSINYNFFQENLNIIKQAYIRKNLFLALLGISWFWFVGNIFLSGLPILAKNDLLAHEGITNIFLTIFSFGLGIGSLLCSRIFNKEITVNSTFTACIGMSLFSIDLYYAVNNLQMKGDVTIYYNLISSFHNLRMVVDLFMIAMIGGIYVVPLYTVIQYFSPKNYRSQIVSASNLVSSLFMILSSILLSVCIALGFSIPDIILIVSILNLAVAGIIYKFTPECEIIPIGLLRFIIRFVLNRIYKVKVNGMENFYKAGNRVVIIVNHISYIDAILLAVYLPVKMTFAIDYNLAKSFWIRPLLRIVKAYPIDNKNPFTAKRLIQDLQKNKPVVVFPEGRISLTGTLMKIYDGPGMIAEKTNANILPISINGAQYTPFSKLHRLVKIKWFPQITMTILEPVKITANNSSDLKARRKAISHQLYDLMSEVVFRGKDYHKTLFSSLLESAKFNGYSYRILYDLDTNQSYGSKSGISYRSMLTKTFILGNVLSNSHDRGEAVGLMLPNTTGAIISFYAMQAHGIVPAMINFTTGVRNIISSCRTAKIGVIYTSRRFIENAKLEELVHQLDKHVKLVFLEDLREKIGIIEKIKGYLVSYIPSLYYNSISPNLKTDATAVILFTSGSEGDPKAVVLSHENLQSNIQQINTRLDFNSNDFTFNALPMFHCFGLGVSLLMIAKGVRTFLYPSPTHYKIIPELLYDLSATIIFGTDTFLNGYAKYAHPYDFFSLRYVIAGAEKLQNETRESWSRKFGIRIFEGYGTTEASPAIAVNTPIHTKSGSVGRLLPGIKYHVEPVPGINIEDLFQNNHFVNQIVNEKNPLQVGRLYIKGPNVMLGYLDRENPGEIIPVYDEKLGYGWYDTGDIVEVDEQGYIFIIDRAKRFAKIGGEMISLARIEQIARKVIPESNHAVISIQNIIINKAIQNSRDEFYTSKSSEIIILFTTDSKMNRENILAQVNNEGDSKLLLPDQIIYLDSIPLMASGKTDYQKLKSDYLHNLQVEEKQANVIQN